MQQKITPFFWFDSGMDKIVSFYQSIFPDFKIQYKEKMEGTPSGTVEVVKLSIHDYKMAFMTAGPYFKINPSISLCLSFDNEADLDLVWNKLSEGGEILMPNQKYDFAEKYGWLKDKNGITWQLICLVSANFPKIYPAMTFTQKVAGRAAEAIDFYTSIFPNSQKISEQKYGNSGLDNPEYLIHSEFKLSNQFMIAMDSGAGHQFTFSEAVSFVVDCEGQEEVDFYWNKLTSEGGSESQCGWCKDKFGVSWQIVPKELNQAIRNSEVDKRKYAVEAMLKMKKIIVKELYQ